VSFLVDKGLFATAAAIAQVLLCVIVSSLPAEARHLAAVTLFGGAALSMVTRAFPKDSPLHRLDEVSDFDFVFSPSERMLHPETFATSLVAKLASLRSDSVIEKILRLKVSSIFSDWSADCNPEVTILTIRELFSAEVSSFVITMQIAFGASTHKVDFIIPTGFSKGSKRFDHFLEKLMMTKRQIDYFVNRGLSIHFYSDVTRDSMIRNLRVKTEVSWEFLLDLARINLGLPIKCQSLGLSSQKHNMFSIVNSLFRIFKADAKGIKTHGVNSLTSDMSCAVCRTDVEDPLAGLDDKLKEDGPIQTILRWIYTSYILLSCGHGVCIDCTLQILTTEKVPSCPICKGCLEVSGYSDSRYCTEDSVKIVGEALPTVTMVCVPNSTEAFQKASQKEESKTPESFLKIASGRRFMSEDPTRSPASKVQFGEFMDACRRVLGLKGLEANTTKEGILRIPDIGY
jgi:hypothetical protein